LKTAVGIGKEIVVAGVMDKIELWPKDVYERNLRDLLEGKSADMDLAKMAEEAFALLSEEPAAVSHAQPVDLSRACPTYFPSQSSQQPNSPWSAKAPADLPS
jgi:hypothetical protein